MARFRDLLSWPVAIIIAAVVVACLTVYVGIQKTPNTLAASLLQGLALILGILGAYYFGKASAAAAAREMVAPYGRSAFRRQRNLYKGLGRLNAEISNQVLSVAEDEAAYLRLQVIRAMVVEMASTAEDALADWRDIVPDEVKRLENEEKLRLEEGRLCRIRFQKAVSPDSLQMMSSSSILEGMTELR